MKARVASRIHSYRDDERALKIESDPKDQL